MGIRFEKDTILNWINEMGKFLRLLVDQWEDKLEDAGEVTEVERGYAEFFRKDRSYFQGLSYSELDRYIADLAPEQIRPLAQLMMYDGLMNEDRTMLERAKYLLELYMRQSGTFAFEDYEFLGKIDAALKDS